MLSTDGCLAVATVIEQMLQTTATAWPERDAIVYLDQRITYEQLLRAVHSGADGLRLHGLGAGDTVLLALTNCPEFVMAYFATALLHARVYAIDPNAAEPELRRCIRDAEPALVITHAMQAGTFRRLLAERSDLRARIAVVGGERGMHLSAADLFVTTGTAPLPAAAEPYAGDWSVTYSSGSTGNPKRICRTQRNQVSEAEHITVTAGIGPQDRMLCAVPLFHALGQFCCMIASIRAGATLVLLEQTGPPGQDGDRQLVLGSRVARVLELIEEHRVTIMPAVPYIYELLADLDERQHADVSSVRLFLSGGNFLPAATAERFLRRYGKPIRQTYGSSEAGSVSWDCRDPQRAVAGSVGHPLDGVEVRLVDQDRQPVPAGSVGEVAVRGPSVMTGYDGRPDLTAAVFTDGFYHTGDVGVLDEDGRLHITGRTNLLIDTGGRKVNPLEVEAVLTEHEQVREAVVTGVGTRGGDEVLVAVVVADGTVGADALLDFCRARLSDYKVPHRVVFRDTLPRSPLGKVLRRDLDLAGDTGDTEDTEANADVPQADDRRAEMTDYLVGQLTRLLRIPAERIDVTAPILGTGLNSLMAMQLRLAIERDLGVQAQLGTLLGAHSLSDVATRLFEAEQVAGDVLLPATGSAQFPLSAAQAPYARLTGPAAAHTFAARIDGDVDETGLQAAFQELVDRHPMLRVALLTTGDRPAQRVAPQLAVDFTTADITAGELPDRLAALAGAAGTAPVDGGTGPLHVRLLRVADAAPVLAVGAHKLAVDRWSMAVLLRDLTMILGGQRSAGGTYLPALPYTYRDFVRWSAGQPGSGTPTAAATHGVEHETELTLDAELTAAVRQLSRDEGVSVPVLLLAAVAATTGGAVDTVHWGRDRAEFHDLVGRFSRPLTVPGGHDLRAVLPAVRDALEQAGTAPDDAGTAPGKAGSDSTPAGVRFVDDVGPQPALAPLMRFAAGAAAEPALVGGLRLHPVGIAGHRPLTAPVECRLTRVGGGIGLMWRHDDRTAAAHVDALAARLHDLLRAATARPARTR